MGIDLLVFHLTSLFAGARNGARRGTPVGRTGERPRKVDSSHIKKEKSTTFLTFCQAFSSFFFERETGLPYTVRIGTKGMLGRKMEEDQGDIEKEKEMEYYD